MRMEDGRWKMEDGRTQPVRLPFSIFDPPSSILFTTHHSPLKIGIVWQGSPKHTADHKRSIPLERFAPLVRLEGVRLFSLQKGPGREQLSRVSTSWPIIDLGSRFSDFADTAAAMCNLDLVIAVDTAAVHCAGALGVPVWVALAFLPDWRWLWQRKDSPWYPTMRLFRQKTAGDWDEVFGRIVAAVRER